MLPSFRTILATFCCGFLVMFAGLRLATSFNSVNQALPVMAAHAAPIRLAALTAQDQQRGAVVVPVTYEMRFAVSAAQSAPVPAAAAPVIDRATPLLMPLVILPPIAQETGPTEAPEQTETTTVAALPSQPAPEPTPAPVTIDIPLPEPATVDLTFSPSPQPAKTKEKPSVAAIAPAPLPAQPPTMIDIPLPEPAAVDLTFPPAPPLAPSLAPDSAPAAAKPEVEVGPKSEATPEPKPETDARSGSIYERDTGPIMVAALPEPIPPGTVKLPTKHIPLPKPKAPERVAALNPPAVHQATRTAAAKAKAKPRRRAVAAKRGDDFESFFNFPTGKQR